MTAVTRPDPKPPAPLSLVAWSVTAAFGAYFCMYAFRKPFTAAQFEGLTLGGIDYKTALVTSQVAGYMVSKFIGIKVIAEMPPPRRAAALLLFVGLGWLALLGFAVVPPPFNVACLFFNGLPLGMVFGLVLGFLEGRRVTEALTAGLCASFILADGVAKTVGAWLLEVGVGPFWMPFVAGALFVAPQGFFVWMLTRLPPPTADDIARRSERVVMTRADRARFFGRYAAGLSLLVAAYLMVTILRGIRADFAPEIWRALGYAVNADVFARSEMVVALGVVVINGSLVLVDDNRRAFFAAMGTAAAGLALVAVALLGLAAGPVGPFGFMVLVGLGLYVPYVAFHTTIFERLLALLRERGNLGYLMYLADAFGYLGYVAVMVARNFVRIEGDFRGFFLGACWVTGLGALVLLLGAWAYFALRGRAAPCIAAGAVAYYQPAGAGAAGEARVEVPGSLQGKPS